MSTNNLHPIFESIISSHIEAQKVAQDLAKPEFPMQYKTYTIEEDYCHPYRLGPQYMFFPTEQGEQHDADCTDGESYSYTGNCKWADSIEEAKLLIDEIVPFYVETYTRRGSALNITKFDWLSDAIRFAGRFNGELSVQFTNP